MLCLTKLNNHTHCVLLQEVAETDSEITLTAPPPSNLDDISRINTPNSISSGPRGLMSRENTNLSGVPRVDTVPEVSETKTPGLTEPWSVGQEKQPPGGWSGQKILPVENQGGQENVAMLPEINETADNEPIVAEDKTDHLKIAPNGSPGGEPPQIDADQVGTASAYGDENPTIVVEDGRVDYMQRTESGLKNADEDVIAQEGANNHPTGPGGAPPQIDPTELGGAPPEIDPTGMGGSQIYPTGLGGAPPQIDEDQLSDNQDFEASGSACKPLQPVLTNDGHKRNSEEMIDTGDSDLLDRFDVTEESLKDELKEELEKFKE